MTLENKHNMSTHLQK